MGGLNFLSGSGLVEHDDAVVFKGTDILISTGNRLQKRLLTLSQAGFFGVLKGGGGGGAFWPAGMKMPIKPL